MAPWRSIVWHAAILAIAAGKKGHVGSMLIRTSQPKTVELLAEALL